MSLSSEIVMIAGSVRVHFWWEGGFLLLLYSHCLATLNCEVNMFSMNFDFDFGF
jgi:hypothetical protein